MKTMPIISAILVVTILLVASSSILGCASQAEQVFTSPPTQIQSSSQIAPTPSITPPSTPQETPATQKPPTNSLSNTISLTELMKNPKVYVGKEIIVTGILSNVCCSTDFVMKDGFENIQVYLTAQSPIPPVSKMGSPISVLGTIRIKGETVNILAREVRF